jgi:hypothetical protein
LACVLGMGELVALLKGDGGEDFLAAEVFLKSRESLRQGARRRRCLLGEVLASVLDHKHILKFHFSNITPD